MLTTLATEQIDIICGASSKTDFLDCILNIKASEWHEYPTQTTLELSC